MTSLTESLAKIFERDLLKLEGEMKLYKDDASVWKTGGEIKNPAGNLCLHLCGNLQHYVGHVLGKTNYKRNRDLEFASKAIPLPDLLAEVQKTRDAVALALRNLDSSVIEKEYPEKVFDYPMTTGYFLIHLAAHLSYHLGQINYHRRLLGDS